LMTHASGRSASTLYLMDMVPLRSFEFHKAAEKAQISGCPTQVSRR
jgi:hypothetical protein